MRIAAMLPAFARTQVRRAEAPALDMPLLLASLALLLMGVVMVASASVSIADRQLGAPFHFALRQMVFAAIGLGVGWAALKTPLALWERIGPMLLIAALVLLTVLLIPGMARTVNGSTRWLALGPVSLQVSEFAKLAMVVYLAGYLIRHGESVRTQVAGFLKPMAVVALFALLLLAEPDFGATVVLAATVLGMMFLGGVRLWLFGVLLLVVLGGFGLLAVSSPYRLERLTAFLNPWADPFDSGFQLTQALIAFGRGHWFGVGLGESIQKLFYLPEAHTDFVMAVLAEELGLFGVVTVVMLFALVVWRAFVIARRAAQAGLAFGAHLAVGIALWLGLQAFINMGVNMGLLPTKGLTLPLMSYGGSSVVATCVAIALLLRIGYEAQGPAQGRRVAGR